MAPIPRPGDVGAQAVALRISGDQAAFWGCGFFGAQDTLHDDRGRHYFKECFIQGSIDFIFGDARSLYEVSKTIIQRLEDNKNTLCHWLLPPVHFPELQGDFHSRSCSCRGENHHRFSHCACPGICRRQHWLLFCQLQHWRHRQDMAGESMETIFHSRLRLHFNVRHHCLWRMEWLEWSFKRPVCILSLFSVNCYLHDKKVN